MCACLRRRERLALSLLLSMRRMRFISGGGKFLSSVASQECSPSSMGLSPRLDGLCSSGMAPVSSSPEEWSVHLALLVGCWLRTLHKMDMCQ